VNIITFGKNEWKRYWWGKIRFREKNSKRRATIQEIQWEASKKSWLFKEVTKSKQDPNANTICLAAFAQAFSYFFGTFAWNSGSHMFDYELFAYFSATTIFYDHNNNTNHQSLRLNSV
jgi:hypothetical protein